MGVLLDGTRVGLPYMANGGVPVPMNALYDGVQVWPPAAETLVDVWLKPVDFTAQALYADHPEVKVAAQKVFADGHIEDASLTLTIADSAVASISNGTVSFVSDTTNFLTVLKRDAFNACHVTVADGGTALGVKQIFVQPDQPDTAPVGSLWCRTEKLHNGLKYYTGSVGSDANVMCFLLDRIREVWRREWDDWKLLTGKELERDGNLTNRRVYIGSLPQGGWHVSKTGGKLFVGDTNWKGYAYLNEMTDEAEFHLDKTTSMLMQAQDGTTCRDIAIESKPAYDIYVVGGGLPGFFTAQTAPY